MMVYDFREAVFDRLFTMNAEKTDIRYGNSGRVLFSSGYDLLQKDLHLGM